MADSTRTNTSSPFRLVGIGLAATIVLVLCVGVVVWRSYVVSENRRAAARESSELLDLVDFYGTSTTRYREATIETGEQVWAEAYREYADRLQAMLATAASRAPRGPVRSGVQRADSLNRRITELEKEAMALALRGRRGEARATVDSREFVRLIHQYGDALLQFSRASDPAEGVSAIRVTLRALDGEVEVLKRARVAALATPPQVQAASQRLGRRLRESASVLPPYVVVHESVDSLIASFGRLVSVPREDGAGFGVGLDELAQRRLAVDQHLDEYASTLQTSVLRERLVMPLLLSLILVVLVGAWAGIVRVVRRNLDERARAVEQLREMELKTEALVSAIPDLIFLHDSEGTYLDYRAPSDQHLIKSPVEFLNKNIVDVLPPEVALPSRDAIRKAAATGEPQYLEYELSDNGQTGIYEARLVPMGSDRVLGIVRDVTRRRTAERAQREAELRFRALVEHSLVGIYMIQDGSFLYVNPRFAEILGRAEEELVGTRVLDIIVPEDRQVVEDNLRRRLDGEIDHIHYTVRGIHGSGSLITAEVYGSTTQIGGRPAIIGTLLDVTERERARKEIASLKAFYEETLNRMPIEIAVLDRDLRYVYLNPLAARTPELQERLLGSTLEEYCQAHGLDEHVYEKQRRWLTDVVASGRTSSMEETVRAANGATCHVLRVAAPVRDQKGDVQHVVGYALDITERKEYEHKLLDAKDRAEEMARLKSAFLANMSHEIRTPLTGIMGFASLLEEEVDDEQRQFASLIVRSGKRLLDTLNAVLDLSRLEAGEMRLEIRSTDLCYESREIASFLRSLASEKNIELRVSTPPSPVRALVDPGALHIVLNNLIGNAIKFTDRGYVSVTVGEEGAKCLISIADTGVGIDASFLPQLFEEFKQESIGLTRSHEGAGLGLAITRRLVLMMEGSINVRSEKGSGTVFEITFPRAPDQLDLPLESDFAPSLPRTFS